MSFAKANAVVRDLADKLSKRLQSNAGLNFVRQTQDATGWPVLFISNNGVETEGAPVVAVRVKGVDMVSKDIFGNALVAYAPHTLELAYELAAANKPEPATADIQVVAFEAIKTGIRYQVKELANLTAVTTAAMDAAAPVVDVEELYWPTKSV